MEENQEFEGKEESKDKKKKSVGRELLSLVFYLVIILAATFLDRKSVG